MDNSSIIPHLNPSADIAVLDIVILTSYIVTFIIGLCGNGLVLAIIGYHSEVRQKSVANYYIWNLSLADLLFILTLPFFFYTSYAKDWPFGNAMCKVGFVLKETNRFSSIFTLVALSFDRFIASFYNLGHLRTIRVGLITCVIIWILCGVISSPYWLYAHTSIDHHIFYQNNVTTHRSVTRCDFPWPMDDNPSLQTFWVYFQLVIGLLIPFLIIFVSYTLLAIRLRRLTKSGQHSSIKKPSRKTTRTVIVVVLLFLVCQIPHYATELWSLQKRQRAYREEMPSKTEIAVFPYINSTQTILVFISSCINPVLYGLMNDNYRQLYRLVFCRSNCIPVKRKEAEPEPPSCDSNGPSSSSSVTYRFQITFHRPCFRQTDLRRKRARSTPTENLMLSERQINELKMNESTSPMLEKNAALSLNGQAGIHLG